MILLVNTPEHVLGSGSVTQAGVYQGAIQRGLAASLLPLHTAFLEWHITIMSHSPKSQSDHGLHLPDCEWEKAEVPRTLVCVRWSTAPIYAAFCLI